MLIGSYLILLALIVAFAYLVYVMIFPERF